MEIAAKWRTWEILAPRDREEILFSRLVVEGNKVVMYICSTIFKPSTSTCPLHERMCTKVQSTSIRGKGAIKSFLLTLSHARTPPPPHNGRFLISSTSQLLLCHNTNDILITDKMAQSHSLRHMNCTPSPHQGIPKAILQAPMHLVTHIPNGAATSDN